MPIWSLTYQQSVFKRYRSDEHFSEILPTRWRQKSTGIDTEQNYVTVTPCIAALSVKFSPSFGEMKIAPLVRVVPRIYAQFVRIVRR